MTGWVTLDTLHLNVRYPRRDVFRRWHSVATTAKFRELSTGIVVGDLVVRNGANGYKVSVWRGDTRAYLTDQVDEIVGDGLGMGIWLQLGPTFLLANVEVLHSSVKDLLSQVGVRGSWPVHVTRIDLAVDLPELEMKCESVEAWRAGWVGRAKVSSVYFDPRSGDLQSIYVGSRSSAVMLRVYDKVAQAAGDGDLMAWREVWGGYEGPVMRLEWEVRPKKGGFYELVDFASFSEPGLAGLANYLVNWGRLCEPRSADSNRGRWEESELWMKVRSCIDDWSNGAGLVAVRSAGGMNEVSEHYLRGLAGHLSGGMARLSDGRASFYGLLDGLQRNGIELSDLEARAEAKAQLFERLSGDWEGESAPGGAPDH